VFNYGKTYLIESNTCDFFNSILKSNALAYYAAKKVLLRHFSLVAETSGRNIKNIITIVSDDRKKSLYYKCVIALVLALAFALASVINYDRK
jgi:hypothetical protein